VTAAAWSHHKSHMGMKMNCLCLASTTLWCLMPKRFGFQGKCFYVPVLHSDISSWAPSAYAGIEYPKTLMLLSVYLSINGTGLSFHDMFYFTSSNLFFCIFGLTKTKLLRQITKIHSYVFIMFVQIFKILWHFDAFWNWIKIWRHENNF